MRLIIYMYVSQFSNVRFGGDISSSFTVGNGVGQGKILAGFAYCFYCYEFLTSFRTAATAAMSTESTPASMVTATTTYCWRELIRR